MVFIFILSFHGSAFGQTDSVILDHVEGSAGPGLIWTNRPITFHIRLSHNSGFNIIGSTNGFRIYSPNSAEWTATSGSWTDAVTTQMYDAPLLINTFSMTGSGADTISFFGFKTLASGIPDGFSEIVWTVTLDSISEVYVGDTICIDSSYYFTGGRWKWSTDDDCVLPDPVTCSDRYPDWDGPHCFEIVDCYDPVDSDLDGIGDNCDNCPAIANADQTDTDSDNVGDICDICEGFDDNTDTDGDGIPDGCDICKGFNDFDDGDLDTVPDSCDNCPEDYNPGQDDDDGDGIGNACDSTHNSIDYVNYGSQPVEFILSQNHPNPFNAGTVLSFGIPSYCHVRITIFNLLGQKVAILIDKALSRGWYQVFWDGKNSSGEDVPSGIYLAQMEAGTFSETKKLVLIK
jgi:hypothetical protein